MMDPMDALKKSNILVPTSSSEYTLPLPTVIPGNTPIYADAGATGHRTLW